MSENGISFCMYNIVEYPIYAMAINKVTDDAAV